MDSWQLLLAAVGLVAVLAISGRTWRTIPAFRFLPLAYGILLGLAITANGLAGIVEVTAFAMLAGGLAIFAVCIELRAAR
jgi:hypothetical protein